MSGSKEKVIEVQDLFKAFGNTQVLNGFSFSLLKNEKLVVLGKSGSGKSVLIKCIIGLLKPDAGHIMVLGNEVTSLNRRDLNELRARVGFLFQSNALYDSMSVRENLVFPLRRIGKKRTAAASEELVREALRDVGLESTIDLMPQALSGGMKKRVALARTLILQPEIILYDEPTTGLDPVTGREISELINEVSLRHNTSSIVISHDMNCVKTISDRIIVLHDGKCYGDGDYETLKQSDDHIIRQFFIE